MEKLDSKCLPPRKVWSKKKKWKPVMALLFYEVHWLLRSSREMDSAAATDLLLARIMRPQSPLTAYTFGYNVTTQSKWEVQHFTKYYWVARVQEQGSEKAALLLLLLIVKPYKKGRLHNILKSPTLYPISSNSGKNITVFEKLKKV